MGKAEKRIDRFFAWLADYLTKSGLPCRYFLPSYSGDLHIQLDITGSKYLFIWETTLPENPTGAHGVLMGRGFRFPEGMDVRQRLTLIRQLAVLLSRIGPAGLAMLDKRNRDIKTVPLCAEGMRQLAADFLQKETRIWGEFEFSGCSEEDTADGEILVFDFSSSQRKLSLAFHPEYKGSKLPDEILRNHLGALAIHRDTRTQDEKSKLSFQVERAFAYVLSVGINPQMKWGAALPPLDAEATGDEIGPGESLIDLEAPERHIDDEFFQVWDLWEGKHDDFFQNWGNDDLFFLTLLYSPDVGHVAHGGRECPAGTPQFIDPTELRTPSPWKLNGHRNLLKGFSFSDVDDRSTIFGGESRLKEMLDDRTGGDDLLFVTHHCEYVYIGDRVQEICAKHPASESKRLQYLLPPMPQFVKAARDLNWWAKIVDRIPKSDPQAATINLVGMDADDSKSSQELEKLLEACGISVSNHFYPTLTPKKLSSFDKASLCVMRPWSPIKKVIGELLEERGQKIFEPAAPYGFEGTRLWLEAVSQKLGLSEKLDDEKWRRLLDELAPNREELLKKAHGIKAAFVIRVELMEELLKPEFFFGLDPLALLSEFGIETVIYMIEDEEKKKQAPEGLSDKVEIIKIPHDADMIEVLKNSDVHLVYTDKTENEIVAKAGKMPFSIFDLEMGPSGAIRSLQKLTSLAGTSFYRNFNRYLTGVKNG